MSIHWIDWAIILGFLAALTVAAVATRRYARSVADFMVANRCAGRYLLTTAHAMSILGAVSIVQEFQVQYDAGFTVPWWKMMLIPVWMFVGLSGWVVYRWRSTRILTMSQLFEVRYSRNYRIFSGIVAFGAGLIGLGIFPATAARFFIGYGNLPETVSLLGLSLSTFHVVMFVLIGIAMVFAFLGGQITVMVTDFLQGIVLMGVFILLFAFIMVTLDWATVSEGLLRAPAEQSRVHPFHTSETYYYNFWFIVVMAFYAVFIWPVGGWNQAAYSSAKTPHENRMATVLSGLRGIVIYNTVLIMLPIAAFVVLHHPGPELTAVAGRVEAYMQSGIHEVLSIEQDQFVRELRTPVVLAHILPVGLVGAFAAVMMAAFISTNDSYFLQFGAMFIQDVIMPFRKAPFEPRLHMLLLRGSMIGIGLFMILFSMLYVQAQDITMYFGLVASITVGVLAVPMLGALYWDRATLAATWVTAVLSIALSFFGFWYTRQDFAVIDGFRFGALAWVICAVVFVAVSLLDGRIRGTPRFDLDKLLHRRAYRVDGEHPGDQEAYENRVYRVLRITREFNRRDKATYFFVLGWSALNFVVFLAGSLYNLLWETGDAGWLLYWRVYVWVVFALSVVITAWFTVGGMRNLRELFATLKDLRRDEADDGYVRRDDREPADA